MKTIQLTQGFEALVDDSDFELLTAHNWQIQKANCGLLYAKRRPGIAMHREILGVTPEVMVDHRDGNGLNNQRNNLRIATATQNQANAKLRVDNTTGFKGVCFRNGKNNWQAQIRAENKVRYIGVFPTARDAATAYDLEAVRLFGEFALTNEKLGLL